MKPNPSAASAAQNHRDALNQALRQALATSQPALRREALQDVALHLIHPNLLIDNPLLAQDHRWRQEALIIADAFEAVTNGMEEPGLLEALADITEDSLLGPWKHLILAMHFFYEGLDEAVVAHAARIPAQLPAAQLARVLTALVREPSPRPLPSPLARLAYEVAQPDALIQQWVQDVAEGLENDDEALFWGALTDWLESVVAQRPERAQQAVIWAWNQLEWRDFDEAVLLEISASLWGRAESYRLAALGTLPWDAEASSLLWLRFMVASARQGSWDELEQAQAERLLSEFQQAALEAGDRSPLWHETWEQLSRSWNAEAGLRGRTERLPVRSLAPNPSSVTQNGQLDLFAS